MPEIIKIQHLAIDGRNLEVPNPNVPSEKAGGCQHPESRKLRWQAAGRALRHRNFQLFFSGQLISLIGTWMQTVAQSWLVYRLTGRA